MNFKGIYYSLTFRLALAIGLTAALTYLALAEEWGWFLFLGIGWLAALRGISLLFKRNAQKVAFMFDAIDNSDYAFKYATRGRSSNDKLVSDSLNRISSLPTLHHSSPKYFFKRKPRRSRKRNITS